MKVAGIMTGTSCDGLDIACLKLSRDSWKSLWARSAPFPAALRKRVLECQLRSAKLSPREFGELHRDIGVWTANSVARILKSVSGAEQPDAIANHGQTVAHFPASRRMGFTLQLGDPTRIALATGLTVISNFRDGDMAAGGEGAPLAPRFHKCLAQRISKTPIAFHNLGGISNLTYIDKTATLAFDSGPGNAWIDAASELVAKKRFDQNGRIAARGKVDSGAVEKILAIEYFRRRPPKSTGRDDFPFSLLLEATRARNENLVATATAITLESIARAYEKFVPRSLKAIYFCGGGARNTFLLASLRSRLSGVEIKTVDEIGFDLRCLEAQAFAYFGYLSLCGEALGGAWTGVDRWAPPGHITPGRNWGKIVRMLSGEVSRAGRSSGPTG
jgi:anhydro-N-acetylmuramic acid kinase